MTHAGVSEKTPLPERKTLWTIKLQERRARGRRAVSAAGLQKAECEAPSNGRGSAASTTAAGFAALTDGIGTPDPNPINLVN